MSEQSLPLCTGELAFWRSVAYDWVRRPGLTLAIVPEDLNTVAIGRWIRDYACQAAYGDPIADEGLRPDRRATFVYDLSGGRGLTSLEPSALLPYVWSDTQRGEEAELAAQGEASFYLVVTGVAAPLLTSVARWVRDLAQTWPAPRLAAEPSRLFCCCVLTAPRPHDRSEVMEGASLAVHPEAGQAELLQVITSAVHGYWAGASRAEQEYLCLGIADMASGRRPHAELALAALQAEWHDGQARQPDWRPQWRLSEAQIASTRTRLEQAGLGEDWLYRRLSAPDEEQSQRQICRRLWMHGLWHAGYGDDLWSGLTTLARAALHHSHASWSLPVTLPESTLEVLRRCLRLEHQMKSALLHYRCSVAGRARIRAVLDRPNDDSGELRRQYILRTAPWEQQTPQPGVEEDEHLIGICSLGALRDLLLDLLSADQRKLLSKPLAELVETRNRTAHLKWLSIERYNAACANFDQVRMLLSRLRIQ